ncbi:MAG: GlsB/YeaQ/YmgE family stress response membrane protein [Phycisphaerae bacterium]|nr:GlsB/YeaQ/YmgE family stress response membrane protein [Phycisphaerae bacterium]
MSFLWFLLIGLCAGWLANQVLKGGSGGVVGNLVVGVVGAILGGALFRAVGLASIGLLGELVTAFVGAVVLLMILRAMKRG